MRKRKPTHRLNKQSTSTSKGQKKIKKRIFLIKNKPDSNEAESTDEEYELTGRYQAKREENENISKKELEIHPETETLDKTMVKEEPIEALEDEPTIELEEKSYKKEEEVGMHKQGRQSPEIMDSNPGDPDNRDVPENRKQENFEVKVIEGRGCKLSSYTGYHLKRLTGELTVKVTVQDIYDNTPLVVKARLRKTKEAYRHHKVEKICKVHQEGVPEELWKHVLQAAGNQSNVKHEVDEEGRYVCFNIGKTNSVTGTLSKRIAVKSICTDSCQTCSDPKQPAENCRELLLVLTLESEASGLIGQRSIPIWPKAALSNRDLRKISRTQGKGGSLSLNMKKRLEDMKRKRSTNQVETSIKNLKGWREDDKTQMIQEMLNHSIDLVVKNAKTLKIDNQELVYKITRRMAAQPNK